MLVAEIKSGTPEGGFKLASSGLELAMTSCHWTAALGVRYCVAWWLLGRRRGHNCPVQAPLQVAASCKKSTDDHAAVPAGASLACLCPWSTAPWAPVKR